MPLGAQAPEREMLRDFLDWYRAVVVRKVEGMALEDATRVMTPSGLSPLGVVAHLAGVETGWFYESFTGEPEDPTWEDHGNFRIVEGDTVASVIAEYETACAQSRAIEAAVPTLDDVSVTDEPFRGHVTLRWVLVHMIEETARHVGHLDLMCEQIDGRTGD